MPSEGIIYDDFVYLGMFPVPSVNFLSPLQPHIDHRPICSILFANFFPLIFWPTPMSTKILHVPFCPYYCSSRHTMRSRLQCAIGCCGMHRGRGWAQMMNEGGLADRPWPIKKEIMVSRNRKIEFTKTFMNL